MHLKAVREDYCSLFGKKVGLSKRIISAVDKYKTNKDRTAFKSVKNQIESERKQINSKLSQIEKEHKFPADITSKVCCFYDIFIVRFVDTFIDGRSQP